MKEKLFTRDFTLVAIGQIISLFGNAALRFALPLYLLNQTGSSSLYGTVTAFAFIPSILLSPIGGIIADRINKRNIMVILDFAASCLVLTFSLLLGKADLILLLTVTLMLLYGIAGAYQPSVQASIPALVRQSRLMAANSVINTVNSFSSLIGPVLGGLLYSAYGLKPVLWICTVCFAGSAVMELFIRIPNTKQNSRKSLLQTVRSDFGESIRFIRKEKPILLKGVGVVCAINCFLSAMIIVGLPYMITEILDFSFYRANRLYGYTEGALAAGGLAGGICAGLFAGKLPLQKAGNLLTACAVCIFPMGAVFFFFPSLPLFNYIVMTLCCFAIMVFSTIFTVQMLSFIQAETPPNLTGKVIAVTLTLSMCAQPAGSALYGILFELCAGFEYAVILFSGLASLISALAAKKLFGHIA